jgi:hypothetical protein
MGTNICLFTILPFAYFYHETEDFHFGTSFGGGELHFVYKFRSALLNWILLGYACLSAISLVLIARVTLGGTVYILREFVVRITDFRPSFFQFSHSLITLTGSFFVLGMFIIVLLISFFLSLFLSFFP